MKKKVVSVVLSIAMVTLLLAGCGSSGGTSSESISDTTEVGTAETSESEVDKTEISTDEPVELIFTSVSVSGDSHTEAMSAFAEKVEELSGGSVTCKIYSDGSLFSSENEFDAVLSGDADLAYISFPTLATQPGLEWCAMLQSGYFWSSYDHMTNILNGDIGINKIRPTIEENLNLVPLSSFYLGARVVNTRDKEINSYDDMSGILLRMPNSETWLNLGEALGANPTPLSFSELYTALQTGAVDGQENPLPTDVSAKFYEVTSYIAITNHVIDSILPCINKDTWNAMTQDQQTAVTEAMEYARSVNDEKRLQEEEKDIAFLEGEGMTITYPDLTEFKENVQEYYKNNSDQTEAWDMDLYNEIQAAVQ
ncbi:MAG: sialic acid TRAP transporter substrate-binding protein SiaP [Lachnospiraceae bacterium]